MKWQRTKFQEKLNEALKAVLPIIGIVLVYKIRSAKAVLVP